MKIVASKRDEILKRKAEYEDRKSAFDARRAESGRKFRAAQDEVLHRIDAAITNLLSDLDLLKLKVHAAAPIPTFSTRGAKITITCSTGPLRWEYIAQVDEDGTVQKDTSSWSGLSATTKEEIESLKQTVVALDRLADVNWSDLLDVEFPNYLEFYDEADVPPEKEDFDAQLREAFLEEHIGKNELVKVYNWDSSVYYGKFLWIQILGQTSSFYRVKTVSDYGLSSISEDKESEYIINALDNTRVVRVKKSNVRYVEPGIVKEF